MVSGYHYRHMYAEAAVCNIYNFLLLGSRHDRFAVAAYKDEEMIEVVDQRPKSLKGRIPCRLEHASRTGVSGVIQVGLSGNLGECNNSSSIKIVSHRKVVELQYALHKDTRGRLQPAHRRSKVRNNHLLCQNKQMTTH